MSISSYTSKFNSNNLNHILTQMETEKSYQNILNLRSTHVSTDKMYTNNTNTSINDHSSQLRRYNEGSVYRQATRFNPYLSSSTNISSSISGSVEIIISDLEERIDSQSKQDLVPLNELSDENSDDPDTVFIQNIINQKRSLSVSSKVGQKSPLDSTMLQLLKSQKNEKLIKEKNVYQLKLQILDALRNK